MNKLNNFLQGNQDINYTFGDYNGEPFYIFDSWDDIDRIGDENLEGISWGFSDEYTTCSNCGEIIHMYNYYETEYIITEGEILCNKCVTYENIIDEFENNPKNAAPEKHFENIKTELVENHWHKIGEYDFQMGENPQNIINDIFKRLKNKYNFVWCLTGKAQFGASANLYIKRV